MRAACDAAGLALVPLVAPTTPDERMARIGATARGFVYAVSTRRHDRRARGAGRHVGRARRARQGPHESRSRSASASGRPSRRVEAADAGADGVIVGTRLVRAAGDGEDMRALVEQFAQALREAPVQ